MELVFFKVAFFVVMGIAALSLLVLATMVGTVVLKALWSGFLRAHTRIAKTGHA